MKKIFIILCLLFGIINVYADCTYEMMVDYGKKASQVTYNTNYDYETGEFSITLYNLKNNIFANTDIKSYQGDSNGEAVISGLKNGEYLTIDLRVEDSSNRCSTSLKSLYITIPYFNSYYGTYTCSRYKDKLKVCSEEFLSYNVTKEILETAIENYNNSIENEPKESNVGSTVVEKVEQVIKNYWIAILLVLLTSGGCIWFYQVQLRKIKHGI